MERLNEVMFIGNIGVIRKQGESKATFLCVALNENYKPKDSEEWVDKTTWVDVSCFGLTHDKFERANIGTGDTVLVIGKLENREYEGKKFLRVVANKIQLIAKSTKKLASTDVETPTSNDEIPF